MQTTSSAISDRPSAESSPRTALIAWLVVAGLQIAIGFLASDTGDSDSRNLLYDYDLAITSAIVYGILIGITFWIASAYPNAKEALGLRPFAPRWLGLTAGVIVASVIVSAALEPLLHAGEEQGLSPEVWRPDRATAFLVNAIIISTLVPFTEELFFRGLGVRVLRPFGSAVAIGGTAVIFALAHGLLVGLPALVFFALGLAWVRLRSDSVWPGVIAHGAYNAIGVAIAYASVQ